MKRNIKGLVALGISAFIAVGIATATLIVVTEDSNGYGELANTTINVDEIVDTINSTPKSISAADESKAHVAPTYIPSSKHVISESPAQTITLDSRSDSSSNSDTADNAYLYGSYIKEMEEFLSNYFNYYNPEISFNKNLFTNTNVMLTAQAPKMTSYSLADVEDNYKDDAEDNAKADVLMTKDVLGSVAGSYQATTVLSATNTKDLASNNLSGIGMLAMREFVKWHLGEENNMNIQVAYNQLASINEVSSMETWWAFCDAFTEYKYKKSYDNAVDQFVFRFLNEYTLPGTPPVLAVDCATTGVANFYNTNAVNTIKDEYVNDLKVESVANEVTGAKVDDSDLLKKENVKYASAVETKRVAIEDMSDAEFNAYAKKEILAVFDSNLNFNLLKAPAANSDSTKVRAKFYDSFLKQYDNVYTAYMNLMFINNDSDQFEAVADKFWDDLAIDEYESQVDTFLADFADEYGIASLDDVSKAIENHKATLQATMTQMDKLDALKDLCIENIKNEEVKDNYDDKDDDEDCQDLYKEEKPAEDEEVDEVDEMPKEKCEKAANDTATTLKDAFIAWHQTNSNDIEAALDQIVYLNYDPDSNEWYSFADSFYYQLTGILPARHDKIQETVEAAATTEEKKVDSSLSDTEIATWKEIIGAKGKELGYSDQKTIDLLNLTLNTTDADTVRGLMKDSDKGGTDKFNPYLEEKAKEIDAFYKNIEDLTTALNNDPNVANKYGEEEVLNNILCFVKPENIAPTIKATYEIVNVTSQYTAFVDFINKNNQNINTLKSDEEIAALKEKAEALAKEKEEEKKKMEEAAAYQQEVDVAEQKSEAPAAESKPAETTTPVAEEKVEVPTSAED